jgi:hypothetical protein
MALGGRMTYAAAMRMEQLLVETSRAFDIVFEESPAALAAYDLVIVPNVECMSLDQITGLTDHVRNGGRLFVGQDSAMFDLWHRRRIENPWAALFGDVSARNVVADAVAVGAAGVFVAAQAAAKDGPVARVTLGQGRAAYAPLVVDPAGQPSLLTVHGGLNTGLDYTNWVVPERAAEFNDAIDWLLEGRETVRVTGPRGLLAEVMRQDEPRRRLVHLVNLAHAPLSGCEVRIRGAVEARDIQILHPPADTTPRWDVEEEGGVVRVRLDELDVYAVVVVKGLS